MKKTILKIFLKWFSLSLYIYIYCIDLYCKVTVWEYFKKIGNEFSEGRFKIRFLKIINVKIINKF